MTLDRYTRGSAITAIGVSALIAANGAVVVAADDLTYPIVDTNQTTHYGAEGGEIEVPTEGEALYGQDAMYEGTQPSYTDNGDGTVTDDVTGLTWAQQLAESPVLFEEADGYCEPLTLGEYDDWRVPNLKELWSIRDFSEGFPYVDNEYFGLVGDGREGATQHTWSSNEYLVTEEGAAEDVDFAVNDWTGHIKSFDGARWVRCVTGNEDYGVNDFADNEDGTISDEATGLMWSVADSGEGMDWADALVYAAEMNEQEYLGYDDWRVPDIKELQSIADYSGVYPAIDTSLFEVTDEDSYFWSSTSGAGEFAYAWYLAAGFAVDTHGNDTHGAGAVRFDMKVEGGVPDADPERIYNYVRLVRTEIESDFLEPEGAGNPGNAYNAEWSNERPAGGERPDGPPADGEGPAGPPADGERPAGPPADGERPGDPPDEADRPAGSPPDRPEE